MPGPRPGRLPLGVLSITTGRPSPRLRESSMTLEPVPDEGASAVPSCADHSAPGLLRTVVRRQLERRMARGPTGPAISFVGEGTHELRI